MKRREYLRQKKAFSNMKGYRTKIVPILSSAQVTKLKRLPAVRNNNKYVDTYLAGAQISSAGTFYLGLNDIIQGTDFNQRVGRRIGVTKIELRYMISQSAAQVLDTTIRLLLIRDTKPDAGANNYLIYTAVGNPLTSVSGDIEGGENDRTKVLRDHFIGLGHGGSTSGDLTMVTGKMILNLIKKPIVVQFDAATALFERNKIALIASSNVGVNFPLIDVGCRVYFHDMP